MSAHHEIRFSGSGGQGMMLLGDVMAQAAGILEGKEILLTKSYGPESRGGACRSELIVDDQPIDSPTLGHADVLLAMTQLACDAYASDLAENGTLVVDSGLVQRVPERKNIFRIPLTALAKEVSGKEIAANVVALGALAVLGNIASPESVRAAMHARFPEKLREANDRVFDAGMSAARKALEEGNA